MMKGCRPLNEQEVEKIISFFSKNRYGLRDIALVLLGLYTGRRISQLLSVKVEDVYNSKTDKVNDRLWFARQHVKGKREGEVVILHPKVKTAIKTWVEAMPTSDFLFCSQKGGAISRMQAHRILKEAVEVLNLEGKVATHSMRKTFAKKMYGALDNDIYRLQRAMGHTDIKTTVKYLSFQQEDIDDAILGM